MAPADRQRTNRTRFRQAYRRAGDPTRLPGYRVAAVGGYHLPFASPTNDPASHDPGGQGNGHEANRRQLAVRELDAEELVHRDEASSIT